MSRRLDATSRRWWVAAVATLGLVLAGCPNEGAECSEGLTRCGLTCEDLTSDSDNCGTCGVACGQAQVCAQGACQCREGSTLCGTQCSVTSSDPLNCGGCGQACAAGQVCEAGVCKVSCSLGQTQCGDSCVDLQADALHCGACGTACPDSRVCRAGVCTYDVVAACLNTGQVVGLNAAGDFKGTNAPVGDRPQTVARMQDVLLALDASKQLRQARLFDFGVLGETDAVGSAPNQVLVADPYVYVINSLDNTLVTFERKASPGPRTDGTAFPGGLDLQPTGSLNFGENTNPFAMVRVGDELYVTLYGNLFAAPSSGGQVARVSLANPAMPTLVTPLIDLPRGTALRPFPNREPLPTPAGITLFNGRVYATLNNLDAFYDPAGPGLLARIDPSTQQVTYLSLGDSCLNPGWVAPVGNQLVVSCAGRVTYDSNWAVSAVEKAGLVLLGADEQVLATWTLACPAGATDCAPPSAGRFAAVGSRVYLGDNTAGRIFVVEVVNNGLVERRGPSDNTSILACPNSAGASLVGDVVSLQ